MGGRKWYYWLLTALVSSGVLLAAAHYYIRQRAHVSPPALSVPAHELKRGPGTLSRFDRSSVRKRGQLLEVRLLGTPEEIGYAHSRLLYDHMVRNERILWGHLEDTIPSALARTALLDLALWKYKDVQAGMSRDRLLEIAATARGFYPDPFSGFFDTFQRFVYLSALYDISLSFEHSPLIGCTTFLLNIGSAQGDALLARNFDFEVDPIFDREKAVFLVYEAGKIPFASVAWPGLVGVVSGMNAEGVAVVVHGGRAGTPSESGEPVVHALRRVLSTARTADEAVHALAQRPAMVSHLVIVLDGDGRALTIERAPGHPDHVKEHRADASVTNHFEGPLANDPKNLRVRDTTSTLARRARGDELLARLAKPRTVRDSVALLRDRRWLRDRELALGDRSAIDALIATHGVVMNTRKRRLWVSEGPHLLGRFIAFDLNQTLGDPLLVEGPLETIDSDPVLQSPAIQRHLRAETP